MNWPLDHDGLPIDGIGSRGWFRNCTENNKFWICSFVHSLTSLLPILRRPLATSLRKILASASISVSVSSLIVYFNVLIAALAMSLTSYRRLFLFCGCNVVAAVLLRPILDGVARPLQQIPSLAALDTMDWSSTSPEALAPSEKISTSPSSWVFP